MSWDEPVAKKPAAFDLGADLSALSVKELEEYIALLAGERDRVEAVLAAKRASQNAAHSIFKS
ncbi:MULTISPECIES: DUF1192 domain-containing protein [Rhodomicrobium]|uniref:DUF1192 domain-containing protein n=1 Tax=Rhodomicrobium TaxID=1068 RepID=UPI000B4BFC92|nr:MULTISPECIES: DUF1192 domain-containing protein [Rhodomicrobium]